MSRIVGTTITAEKVNPIMTPQAQERKHIRNGDNPGVIRDEIITFYGFYILSCSIMLPTYSGSDKKTD